MTIDEIKELMNHLEDDQIDEIKKEIKSKEDILKNGNLEEEELVTVLNNFFAILVIEKTLETKADDIEHVRNDLEDELRQAYEEYDYYMSIFKKEKKEKKKRWLLQFLNLSNFIDNKKKDISKTDKQLKTVKKEIEKIHKQKSDDNLEKVVSQEFIKERENFKNQINEIKIPKYSETISYERKEIKAVNEERPKQKEDEKFLEIPKKVAKKGRYAKL